MNSVQLSRGILNEDKSFVQATHSIQLSEALVLAIQSHL